MAIRFRKSVKIIPGVRLNIGKKGISTSIGGRGATVNISKRGTRVTAGLPGTGLSASQLYKSPAKKKRVAAAPPEYSPAEWAVAAISLEVIALLFWKHLSGFLSFAGAAIALIIPGIYIARWIITQREETLMAKELDELARERAEIEAKATPRPAVYDGSPSHSGKHWSEIVKSHDARRKPAPAIQHRITAPESAVDDAIAALELSANRPDYLGLAAQAGNKAKEAIKAGDFNVAWSLFHDQKTLYLQHAGHCKWSARDAITLDASVHESLADVLRLEKRHKDALPHILYWVAAGRHRPIKRHSDKLRAYFNRCRLANTTLEDLEIFISNSPEPASYVSMQAQTKAWIDKG